MEVGRGVKLGSIFSGYGGLDMGVEAVFNTRTVWTCDAGAGPARVLSYRYPHAPNLGDITAVDWASVEPVDVIAGGSPCQDLSLAGATPRLGMAPGTRSGLWGAMCDAIETIRPRVVVWGEDFELVG